MISLTATWNTSFPTTSVTPRQFHDGGVDGLTSRRLQSRDAVEPASSRPQSHDVFNFSSNELKSHRPHSRDAVEPASSRLQSHDVFNSSHDHTSHRPQNRDADELTSRRLQSRDVNATWLHEEGRKSSRLQQRLSARPRYLSARPTPIVCRSYVLLQCQDIFNCDYALVHIDDADLRLTTFCMLATVVLMAPLSIEPYGVAP